MRKLARNVAMACSRRQLLMGALAGTGPLFAQDSDRDNIKIAHRINARAVTDDDLLFFQQIGLRWARLEFGEAPISLDQLRAIQVRFAKFGIEIYSGVHYSYRTSRLQLGQAGRDEDIATYCAFLRNLGKLGIPIASYDFHPANTYTTNMVQRRGYTAREFDLEDFRTKVEKRAFDREYRSEEQ